MRAKKINTGIYWKGIYLEVDGYYEEATLGDELTAPTYASFEIDKIKYGGIDIHDVLLAADVYMFEIEKLIIDKLKT